MGCLGCPPCLRTRVAKRARSCPSVGMWSSQQPLAKAPRQWGQGPAPAPTPLLHPLQQASSPGGPQPSWGAEGPSPGHPVPCSSGRCQGYSQREKAPRLPWGTWVESGGPRPPQRWGFSRGELGGDGGQGGTQQCHIPALGPAGPASAQWGGPRCGGRGRGAPSRCQVVGRLGGTLGPLDDGWALLPPQQLVVLKEALVAGHPVGAIREGQETWGGKGWQ